jgi:hypothetical protein
LAILVELMAMLIFENLSAFYLHFFFIMGYNE